MSDAVQLAIQMEVGHPAPFTMDELAGVRQLVVHGARDLSAVADLPSLEFLDLFACEGLIPPVSGLRSLRVACSRTGGLEVLRQLPHLEDLEVIYSDTRDLDPVVAHPTLRRGMLVGLPLDDISWGESVPSLLRRARREDARGAWLVPDPASHALTRELWDAGLELCHATFDGRLPLLVRPGVPRSMRVGSDYVIATPDAVRATRAGGDSWDTATLMRAVVRAVMGRRPRQSYNFRSSRSVGTDRDALAWIERSRVEPAVKASLAAWVHRFPQQVFYKEAPGLTGLDERRHRARLPAWLVNHRTTVAGVAPYLPADQVAWRLTSVACPQPGLEGGWVSLGLFGAALPEHEPLVQAGWFCIGRLRAGGWALVARLGDDSDLNVYGYRLDQVVDGRLTADPVPVFSSWAALLDAVDAVDVHGDITPAR